MGASAASWWPLGYWLSNGAAIAYLLERHAPGSNIHTFGESIWWSVVTAVTTVGYGDYFPVTLGGRITAVFIMAIGILTLAVITAQVASSFVDQAASRRGSEPQTEPENMDSALAALDRRLARIEDLLTASIEPLEASSGGSDEGALATKAVPRFDGHKDLRTHLLRTSVTTTQDRHEAPEASVRSGSRRIAPAKKHTAPTKVPRFVNSTFQSCPVVGTM